MNPHMFFLLMLNRWILRSTSICAIVNWILFCWMSSIKQCPFALSIEDFKMLSNGAGMRFCIVPIYLSGASFKRGLWKGNKNHSVVLLLEYQRSTVASISLDWRVTYVFMIYCLSFTFHSFPTISLSNQINLISQHDSSSQKGKLSSLKLSRSCAIMCQSNPKISLPWSHLLAK